jgi:SOS response regulatory protein OraA/RecX
VRELYKPDDRRAIAMDLARRHLARLNQFPRPIARQRLFGLLARRGFDEDDVLNVVEKMLGPAGE